MVLSAMLSLKLASDHYERSDFFLVSNHIGVQFANTASLTHKP